MVNFRFHLVSLVGVFLALALGIFIGSSVVDQAIVDGLRSEMDAVEQESDARRSENDELRSDLDDMREYADAVAAYSVDGRLSDVPVALVAVRGADERTVADTLEVFRAAGATAPAIVWLEDSWALGDEDDVAALAEQFGATAQTDDLRRIALEALAVRLTEAVESDEPSEVPAGTTVGTTAETEPRPDVLVALAEAGFVSVDGASVDDLEEFPATPGRAFVVAGAAADAAPAELLTEMVRAFTEADALTGAGEVYEQGVEAERGAALAGVRGDDTLAEVVSTVDHLDLTQGRVAAVLAVEQLAGEIVGHYGYGNGAQRAVPEWPES